MTTSSPVTNEQHGVLTAVKQRLPRVLLVSILAGAITFTGLMFLAPRSPFAALSAFTAVATLLLGLIISFIGALRNGSRSTSAKTAKSTAKGHAGSRTEPVLSQTSESPAGRRSAHIDDHDASSEGSSKDVGRGESAVRSSEPTPLTEADVIRVGTIGALARRVVTRSEGGGYRTLVAGETDMMGVSSHAIELAKALAELGQSVILLDWAPEGDGIAHALSLAQGPGVSELLRGRASFEQIIRRVPGSEAHVIAAGAFEDGAASELDPDRLNLVLDALDETYDQVIVAGRNQSASTFFEAIEGRVDCGVLVADPGRVGSVHRDPPGSYLGFEVADIDLVRYDRQFTVGSGHRIGRAGRNPAAAVG